MKNFKNFWKVMFKNKKAFSGVIILILFLLMASVGTRILKLDMTISFEGRYQSPSWHHLLGTDFGGRDTFMQLVFGSKDVLTVGFFSAVFTLLIGFCVGAVSGLLGGKVDTILMFITNLFLTIPSFPIMMIMTAMIKINNPLAFAVVLSIWSWGGLARTIRAQILSLKHREFIVVCKIMGLSKFHIIFKEIMPNLISYIAINFIMTMQGAIVASVGLMMLGLAPYSPTNWGMMLNLAIQNSAGIFNPKAYYYLASPILCLALFQTGCIFFANGLDEALNPRLRNQ